MTSCVSLQVLRLILKVKFCKCISRCLYLFVIVNFLLYIQKINFCGPAIWPKFIHISQHTNNKKKTFISCSRLYVWYRSHSQYFSFSYFFFCDLKTTAFFHMKCWPPLLIFFFQYMKLFLCGNFIAKHLNFIKQTWMMKYYENYELL